METALKNLIGKTVNKILINQKYLQFETDKGDITYRVTADCCSESFFYDFYGIKNLLENGPIIDVKALPVTTEEIGFETCQKYGYQITTIHPVYGEVTSVFSFRNMSNGYYGGEIEETEEKTGETNKRYPQILKELKEDVIEIKD